MGIKTGSSPWLSLSACVASLLWVACAGTPEKKVATNTAVPPPVKEWRSEDLFAQGIAAFDEGKLDEATEIFERVLNRNPRMVNAQYNLGVIAERRGQLSKALDAYEAAHKIDPNHEPTLLNLGKIYRLQDKFDQAITLYETALVVPGREYDVQLLNNLTVAYRLAKKFDKAEAAARKVLSRTKDNPDAYKNLALIYYDQGNYKLAEFISANARKLDDKDPGVYNNLGMIYLKLDDRRAALAQFQKSVSLNDKFAPGHMNIGAMALTYRDYVSAEKAYSKAVALDPTSYEAHLYFAYALDGQKGSDPRKGPLAGAEFEKVLSIKAEHPEAICGAGWAYSSEKSGFDKAINFLGRCRSLASATPQEQQLIDAKLKGIAAMQKSGAAQQNAPAKKEAPKHKGGGSILDKVSDDAAKDEPANSSEAPAEAPPKT
ncbi:MAG: tetratricopeptide repeat protein [Myxococcaceae bacterium]